jgi:hypothetical protein
MKKAVALHPILVALPPLNNDNSLTYINNYKYAHPSS